MIDPRGVFDFFNSEKNIYMPHSVTKVLGTND